MILDKEIMMKWIGSSKSYYESKGYVYTKHLDNFLVKVEDLHPTSKKIILCQCDFCGKIFKRMYRQLYGTTKHSCGNTQCTVQLRKLTCLQKYGVEHALQDATVKEKGKQTMLEKYGVERPLQNQNCVEKAKNTYKQHYGKKENPEGQKQLQEKRRKMKKENTGYEYAWQDPQVLQKIKNTMIDKYGVEHPMQSQELKNKMIQHIRETYKNHNNEIQEKRKNTCLERYGKEHVSQVEEIKKKMTESIKKIVNTEETKNRKKQTMKEKYGYEYPIQNPEIKKQIIHKGHMTLYKNGKSPTSKNQHHICKLLNGKLNYPFMNFFLDIVIDEYIVIEYDGGGHFFKVKIGKETLEEAKRHELEREKIIISNGFKIIRIISMKYDKLFNNDTMMELINICKQHLINNDCIRINIDELKITSNNFNCLLDENGKIKEEI